LTDEHCRPLAFLITGGNVADCKAGEKLLERLPDCDVVNADKAYDTNALREKIRAGGAIANIPPKANRKEKLCFSPFLYRDRNVIERMFCRLKDFRRIATRYDRNAANFLAAICLAAAVSFWL
jgi:transposase